MYLLPVANGMLPRPHGGKITGVFFFEHGGQLLTRIGIGKDVMICPWSADSQSIYPVGVTARLINVWTQQVVDQNGQESSVLLAILEGREHARWRTIRTEGAYIVTHDIEVLRLREMRKEYPTISGAGWLPSGGYTEFRDKTDIPITIYGADLETGKEIYLRANVGGLVTLEQAHTIEHGVIRALKSYGLCSVRTLLDSLLRETEELKRSVELGIQFSLPEIFGRTATGACGNPMSNLAQFYLAQEFVDNIEKGKSFGESLLNARRRTMSQLTSELGLTMQHGVRVLQGLKKGMSHDDTPLKVELCKKIIARFPLDPWH